MSQIQTSLTLAHVATGITTVFGIIGLIYYIILRFSEKNSNLKFSPQIIDALKNNNIPEPLLKSKNIKAITSFLEHQTSLSKEILASGISLDIKHNARYALIISVLLLASGLAFGYWSFGRKQDQVVYVFSGVILDEGSKEPIANVKIVNRNKPIQSPTFSDSRGLFELACEVQSVTIDFTAKDYTDYSLNKHLSSGYVFDTIRLKGIIRSEVAKVKGYVLNESGKHLSKVKVYSTHGQQTTYSNEDGLFEIDIVFEVGANPIIYADAEGYKVWSNQIDNPLEIVPIQLSRE